MESRWILVLLSVLITGCAGVTPQAADPTSLPLATSVPTISTLPNPASAYCEQQGYTSEIRTASDSSQSGVCSFPDGSECDEWAYYRGECSPASQSTAKPDPGSAFCEMLGYTSEIRTNTDGTQVGVCMFTDGSECVASKLLKGECVPVSQLSSMPNPSSVYCTQQGYTLEIRTANDGSQSGVCVFPDGSECDEWAYFRGECKPSSSTSFTGVAEYDSQGWKIYHDEVLAYSFHYPADAVISVDDEPKKALSITGPGVGSEFWGVANPTDREEYRPPENVDLLQWLTDHYLVGENRMPDEQIAGTTAIHYRHERSPQSYASDQYFFAHAGQLYQVSIGHSSESEDLELNNRFLHSFEFDQPAESTTASTPIPAATPIPTAVPIDPSYYQGFWTYTHPEYGFSIKLPEDWVVEETTTGDELMNDHTLILHPQPASDVYPTLHMSFRIVGEEVLLCPTGVGQGEFISQGTLDVVGEPANRIYFVCPNGMIDSIWYQGGNNEPDILRGNMEFGFIYTYSGANCQEPYNLTGKVQLVGEMVIASLQVP
jgi:putative hemolysin